MNNVMNILKKYLVYHEPKRKDEFELLETEYEGTDRDGFEEDLKQSQEQNKEQNHEQNQGKKQGQNQKQGGTQGQTHQDEENGEENGKSNKENDKEKKQHNENSKNMKTKTPLKIEEWNEAKKEAKKDKKEKSDKNDESDKAEKTDEKKDEKNDDKNDDKHTDKNADKNADGNAESGKKKNEKNKKDDKKDCSNEEKGDEKDLSSGKNSGGKNSGKGSSKKEDVAKDEDIVNIKEVNEKLEVNLKKIQEEFVTHKNSDIVIRQFMVAKKHKAFIVFIDGMVDRETINNYILRQLMMPNLFENADTQNDLIEYIEENVLAVHDTKRENHFEMIIRQILNGLTVLFVDGCDRALIFETRGYEKRSVEKPVTENVIKGSQEGFNENLRTNITLIRRIVKNNRLVTEIVPVGRENNSHCGILYIEGLTNPKVVNEVKKRIASLDIDFVSGEGMLEQLIEDRPFMIFPQVLRTERPDRAASFLMSGKVVIVADGTPFIIAVPMSFFHMIQSSEDANMKWQFATVLRNIRAIGLLISVTLPSFYIALTLYHQEMIPTDLLIAIAQSRENVPFPVLIETVLMELSFELIREAGVRVPGIIGTTLGIIGALILGQAAVAAGIVSPILIIVVAVTGLGNYTAPDFALGFSIRILRFALIVLAGLAGFYGISLGLFLIIGSLCNIKSFGVPLLSPVGPKTKGNMGVFFRIPYGNEERSDYLNTLKRNTTSNGDPRKWVK